MSTELAIRTCGLTKHFDRQCAVNEVDLEIAAGEVYGLIGPNGAGKTTLIRMLGAAESPTTGEIYLHGERLSFDRTNPKLQRFLGYLPDDYPLYEDLTVWDYLDYFARLYGLRQPQRRQRLYDVLDLVQLGNKRNSNISTLSRGMKQRLSLARTIIHQPLLLLLDEPVSGLDPIARIQFRDIIKVLQEAGMTIFISSHILSDLAELCTSIGVMELGYLVESTSLDRLYQKFARQHIYLSALEPLDALIKAIEKHPLVKEWEILSNPERLRVFFSGTLSERSDLLRAIVQSGISLTEFHCTQDNLEDIFLKLGHQQAS